MVFTLALRHTFACFATGGGIGTISRDSNSTASLWAVTQKLSVVGTSRLDSECYIRDCPLDTVLDWMSGFLDDLHCVESSDHVIYHGSHNGALVSMTFTLGIADGPFSSVYCGGDALPWRSDAEMARDAYAFTMLPVRWGTDTLDPCDWWQLDAHGERRITWD